MDFKISYEDAKKVLGVFYNSPYSLSAPYVVILDNLVSVDGNETLRLAIEKEHEAGKQVELPKME